MQFTGWTSEECPQLLVRMCWCCWGWCWCSTAHCCWPAQDLMGHVSALWVYIRHRGPATCGSVSLPRKMGHSVATCKYQDSSSVLPGHAVRRRYCDILFLVEYEMKSTNFANLRLSNVPRSLFLNCPLIKNPYIKRMSTHASCNNLHSWCGC